MLGCFKKSILIVAAVLLVCGVSAARAQTTLSLVNGSGTFLGLTATISSCNYTLSGGSSTACTSADGLQLKQVADGRGNVELQLVPTTASAIYSYAGGVIGGGKGITALSYTLQLTTNTPATAKVGSYAVALAGTYETGTTENFVNTASGFASLTANLVSGSTTSCSPSCSQTLGTGVDPLNISASLSITNPTTGFKLTSATYIFGTIPEPASIAMVASGIGGLFALRRRRRARQG